MLKALLLLLMNLALTGMAMAQNLVLNGSFEDTVNCEVSTQCSLLKAEHWSNPTMCTPDLYDCDLNRACGYPMDLPIWNGYILSQDGLRHSGAFFWDGPGSSGREYQRAQFAAPLETGQAYTVSLWYARHRPSQYAIDHIGVWFDEDSVFGSGCDPIDVVPQIKLRSPLSPYLAEAESWTQLTDTFVAAGGEQWMVIGNFDPVDTVDGALVNPDGIYSFCYYHVDNVSVAPVIGASIREHDPAAAWWDGFLAVSWPGWFGTVELRLYDLQGRFLHHTSVILGGQRIDLSVGNVANGAYMLVLDSKDQRRVVKFIKEEGGL